MTGGSAVDLSSCDQWAVEPPEASPDLTVGRRRDEPLFVVGRNRTTQD